MDHSVGTADGQSEGKHIIRVGEPWLVYLEGMEECYVLEPLVIQELIHSVNLGMSFLEKYNLKMICMEAEVALMPKKDGSASRARLVDGGCHSFLSKKSETVLQATKEQMISTQVWRIPRERISITRCRRGWTCAWEYMQSIPVPFPWGWGNISLCRRVVR